MIYQYTLGPIESILETAFLILFGLSNSYFLALVLLALVVRLATKPLEKYAGRAQSSQTEIELILSPQINEIKHQFTAAARHTAIKRLYKRYAYHPVFAVRSLAGLGVQLPFFIAAYFMLSDSELLAGEVVPLLGDLGIPDTLLFGSFHLMPFVMTAVNILALTTAPGFSRDAIIQGLFVSLMFLVLLYEAPLALLIYWTTSNLFSLASNFSPSIMQKYGGKLPRLQFKSTFVGRCYEEYGYPFFVCNLAILLPLLGVLGDQFNFFTAHALSAREIITLLLIVGCAPALILLPLRWLSKRIGFASVFDSVVLFVFLWLFVFYITNSAGYGVFPKEYEPYILLGLSLLVSIVAVVAIKATQSIRVVSYLSLLMPLVLLDFIYVSAASSLFKQADPAALSDTGELNSTPVFLIIFDEFSGTTLQNLSGELDESRYPGFAELAAQADYFPNALTINEYTAITIPSIVSGNLRLKNRGLAPGENLIEVFQAKGAVHVASTVLPADLQYQRDTNYASFVSDLVTLYLHILCHKDWIEEKIGTIPQAWKGFGVFFKEERDQQVTQDLNLHVTGFFNWLEHVDSNVLGSKLNFIHTQFPHAPYNTTALGRTYRNGILLLRSLRGTNEKLDADQPILNVASHNYMHHVSYADSMIAKFIQSLRSKALFEQSLIIVTADHGVSHDKKGLNRRVPSNKDSWKNIISVPLFVKFPDQNAGKVVPQFVTTLDIATTIMHVVGGGGLWESVGENLMDIDKKTQTRSVELVPGYEQYFNDISALFQESRIRKEAVFGEETPIHNVAANYTESEMYAALPGRHLSEAEIGAPSRLQAVWDSWLDPGEVSFFGMISQDDRPANQKIMVAVVDNEIQSVFESGDARNREGFFAFSLPEQMPESGQLEISLYEIQGKSQFSFRKIESFTATGLGEYTFSQKDQIYPYDWKSLVRHTNGLDAIHVEGDGIRVLSSESNDPYVVFEPVSNEPISNPVLRVQLESSRDLIVTLYYQTSHNRKFSGSQSLPIVVSRGSNSIYFKIPESDFSGPYRIDFGTGGETEIFIQDLELRR